MRPIVVLLPRKMNFGPTGATPVDLYAHDSVCLSRHRSRIIVVGQDVADAPFPDVDFRPIPLMPRESHGRWLKRALPRLAALRPALIETHCHRVTATAVARHLGRTPVVMVRHNFMRFDKSPLWHWHFRWAMRPIAGLIFVSEATRRQFVEGVPWYRGGIDVVHNGLAMEDIAPPPSAKETILLQVGRLIPEKGALEFAHAVKPVLARHPEWRAVMIGRGKDEAYVDRVRAAIAEAGDRATLLPFMPHAEVMGWFRRAAIACVPSSYAEPFGRTALEALSAGAALICSGTGGLPEITGDHAVMLPRVDAASIEAALERLIGDEGLRVRLQAEGAAHVRKHFDARAIVARLDDIRDRYLAGG
jgi:glycosyltransferase involved in cell wall biosynthesis